MKYLLFIIVLFTHFVSAKPLTLYVATTGNDTSNGRSPQQAFATIERAQKELRRLKRNRQLFDGAIINIASGKYYLQKPLMLNKKDSGSANHPIIYQGADNNSTLLSGARIIDRCKTYNTTGLSCDTSKLALSTLDQHLKFYQYDGNSPPFDVYMEGKRLELARWPNKSVDGNVYSEWSYTSLASRANEKNRIYFDNIRPKQWATEKNLQVHVWPGYDWHDELIGIRSIDNTRNRMILNRPAAYPLPAGRRFYVRNAFSELDVAGEWFFDDTRENLLLFPPSGSNAINPENKPRVAVTDHIFVVNQAKHIIFENLVMEMSRKTAVLIRNSRDIHFSQSIIRNTGRHAINISGGSENQLSDNRVHNTSLGGILVSGGDRIGLRPANHRVVNNEIYLTNQLIHTSFYPITVSGVGNHIANNLIYDVPYIGIRLSGNNHLIERNELHHTCTMSADCGAIYLGKDWTFQGNQIRHNKIHDIYGYGQQKTSDNKPYYTSPAPNGGRGVYLDNGASGSNVEGNIIYRVGEIGIHINGGRDNSIKNNIVVGSKQSVRISILPQSFHWDKTHLRELNKMPIDSPIWRNQYPALATPMANFRWPEGNEIAYNIFSSTPGTNKPWIPFRYNIPEASTVLRSNLVWNGDKPVNLETSFLENGLKRDNISWQQWLETGFEKNSKNSNPQFSQPNGDNFYPAPTSPAWNMGFQPIPFDQIGLRPRENVVQNKLR